MQQSLSPPSCWSGLRSADWQLEPHVCRPYVRWCLPAPQEEPQSWLLACFKRQTMPSPAAASGIACMPQSGGCTICMRCHSCLAMVQAGGQGGSAGCQVDGGLHHHRGLRLHVVQEDLQAAVQVVRSWILLNAHQCLTLRLQVTREDLQAAEQAVGSFGGDNRAGVPGTLHRISAIRNRKGSVVGLTCRVGRAVTGHIDMIRDILDGEGLF